MAGQMVIKPTSFSLPSSTNNNKITLPITDATNATAYSITVRSINDNWDSLYTIITKIPTITIPLQSSTVRYISVASVNSNNIESLFTLEKSITVPAAINNTASNKYSITNSNTYSHTQQNKIVAYPNLLLMHLQ